MLEREYEFYEANRTELDAKYDGQFIVIVGDTVMGPFDSEVEAIQAATAESHQPGTYLVQYCTTTEDTTQYFRTRAAF